MSRGSDDATPAPDSLGAGRYPDRPCSGWFSARALAPDASPTTSAAGTEHPPLDLAVMALMADEPDAARAAAEDLAVQQTA